MTPTTITLCSLNENRVTDVEPLRAADLILRLPVGWFWRNIQLAAWWLCVRLGCEFDRPYERTEYKRIIIDGGSLLQKARLNSRDLRRLWQQNGKYLIVGAKTAHELWGECADQQFTEFAVSARIGIDGKQAVLDLQVVIVPWIEEGLFVLPELREECASGTKHYEQSMRGLG